MRILCTGARVWPDPRSAWADLDKVFRLAHSRREQLTVVHGHASGADRHVHDWCGRNPEVAEERHPVSPAEWEISGPRAGHLRNERMVKLGADGCVAFCVRCDKPEPCYGLGGVLLPAGHATHGTHGCMELARAARITVWQRWAT